MDMIIAGKDCEECRNCILNEEDKAKVKVICTVKEKEYYWGQCIPCDQMVKKR